jgi:hypothetical protein
MYGVSLYICVHLQESVGSVSFKRWFAYLDEACAKFGELSSWMELYWLDISPQMFPIGL